MRKTSCILVAVAVAGCAPTDPATTNTTTTSPDTTATSGSDLSDSTAQTIPEPDAAATANEAPAETPEPGPTSVVAIDTEPLPSDVATALRDNNGELAATTTWTTRFAAPDFPILDGPDVNLVEANLDATRLNGGWQRLDEMQWLFSSPVSNRDNVLDDLERQADLGAWTRDDTNSTVDAAQCVERSYTNAEASTTWTLQGCDYPTYMGMVAAGVSRRAVFDESGAPPLADPSVPSVLDDLDGQIERVTVGFGAPSGSSTSTLVASTELSTDAIDPSEILATSTLETWPSQPAEAGAVVFSGAPGTTWTVFNNQARFTSEGRLNP